MNSCIKVLVEICLNEIRYKSASNTSSSLQKFHTYNKSLKSNIHEVRENLFKSGSCFGGVPFF